MFNKTSHYILIAMVLLSACNGSSKKEHSIAREWNEVLLESIRNDLARPVVHARNLFHFSAATYDAWATITGKGDTYLLGKTVNGFTCPFDAVGFKNNMPRSSYLLDIQLDKAISYANHSLIYQRFQAAPGWFLVIKNLADDTISKRGFDKDFDSQDYLTGSAAALGRYIAQCYIDYGLQDGANEAGGYANQYYAPINPNIKPEEPGTNGITDINRWQKIELTISIDQAGNPVASAPPFVGAEWGNVSPFSLTGAQVATYSRDSNDYQVWLDPGAPPLMTDGLDASSDNFRMAFAMVAVWSSHMSGSDSTMIDISPASIGNLNIHDYPSTYDYADNLYDFENGGDASPGYTMNPVTGEPYQTQMVKRGDYARVLAEFWADGPHSETPPGHWFTILNYVNDHPLLKRRFEGQGAELSPLEWDVKSYFILGGAMHDVAIAAWGVKGWYDYVRPVSAIRGMAEFGQSSDNGLPNYNAKGLPLIPGYIELVETGDPLANLDANPDEENLNKIKLYAWRGPEYINDPAVDEADVGWILAENWWPYQRPTFVSPPFAGYISGHSTYSRAAAEVLSLLTGSEYFPGGMGIFDAVQNEFLVFEEGPTETLELQWAKYRDASDQCSLSRIWGGIHPPIDDIPGRWMGETIGQQGFAYASQYFE